MTRTKHTRVASGLRGPCMALVIAAVLTMSASAAEPRPLVVGHRGLLTHAPENTLCNFRACLELRLGFEFDVRRAGDGTLVCLHDDSVDRTTDGVGKASQMTREQLARLDAGSKFDPAFRGERVPTVDEVFALVAAHREAAVLIAVDMKGDDEAIEADTVALAKKHGVMGRLLFIGRTITVPQVRARFRQAEPTAAVARLAQTRDDLAAALADKGCDWVYVRFVPTRDDVAAARAAGKKVFIAGPTVQKLEPANWKAAAEAGVDGILTDHPLELRKPSPKG